MCGLYPDIIVARCERPIDAKVREKIAQMCNVPSSQVLQNYDVTNLYEVPLALEREGLPDVVLRCLKLDRRTPDLTMWTSALHSLNTSTKHIKIALVGKYVSLHDAYLSVAEALKHAGLAAGAQIDIEWIDAEDVKKETVGKLLGQVHGLIVPGGFGGRGIEGMVTAIEFARTNNIPFLGICLGMQVAIMEFARNVLGLENANSVEFDEKTEHPVIHLMESQGKVTAIGGTLRKGAYPCVLKRGSKAYDLYGQREISERHRHRYEVNNEYRKALTDAGMNLSGLSPDGEIVEMIELSENLFFMGTQAHPEFKSRPNNLHPLFKGFIEAALVVTPTDYSIMTSFSQLMASDWTKKQIEQSCADCWGMD
jgi:CTP synthase